MMAGIHVYIGNLKSINKNGAIHFTSDKQATKADYLNKIYRGYQLVDCVVGVNILGNIFGTVPQDALTD